MNKYCNIEALFRELAYWLSILVIRKRAVYADTVKLFEGHSIMWCSISRFNVWSWRNSIIWAILIIKTWEHWCKISTDDSDLDISNDEDKNGMNTGADQALKI